MKTRRFAGTGWDVMPIGFGAWAIGADWGEVTETDAMATLHAAVDSGVNLFDTADVYGDGRSEKLLALLRKERPEAEFHIITKAGRRLDPHVAEGYNEANMRRFVERSREYLETERLDLVQLHCPPTAVYEQSSTYEAMDQMVADGLVESWGVSVEKIEEAEQAIQWPTVASVQIIFNMLRQRPAESFFARAVQQDVAVIVRVPLASGLLTGKMKADTVFAANDHRSYNRHGEAFDVGETFAGVPYDVGLAAVEELRSLVPEQATMAQFALRWILMHPEVTVVIPGAKNVDQVRANVAATAVPELDSATMAAVRDVYDRLIRPEVHHRW